MNTFAVFLKKQYKALIMLAFFVGVFVAVFVLYDLPYEPLIYALVLCLIIGLVLFILGYRKYLKRHEYLKRLCKNIQEASFEFPEPRGAVEADYQELLTKIMSDRARIKAQTENDRQNMAEYYAMWAHQIKTPISAMNLLLQEPQPEKDALAAELFKTGEYVDMVLSYLRLGSETNDLVFCRYDLDEIIRENVRRYAKLFIIKKISLTFDETERELLTDSKWLGFVIGQILSNALKYTPSGGRIRIFSSGDDLIIEDSGIGIRQEDIARVFEKGFTGFNGREDKKSTGIGLYLCRETMKKMGYSIHLESEVGKGTRVFLTLAEGRKVIE